MEKESFEDEEVASYLNQYFVAVKVDREERPDIDHLYMDVCIAMIGQGGWPLTLILTPDGKPFFAGTYFPKGNRYGRVGLLDLLPQIVLVWEKERARAESIGEQLASALSAHNKNVKQEMPATAFLDQLFSSLQASFDREDGGFGGAPKFPSPQVLMFLLRHYATAHEQSALEMVTFTLEKMHRGGIYDHIGGGFSRYSTDRKWLIPHFEKMLYDNALLAHAYLDTFHVTKDPVWKGIAADILNYIERDMRGGHGAFYTAEDADSEGEEGKFYLFTTREVERNLDDRDAREFIRLFGMETEGDFEGKNVLHLQSISQAKWRKWAVEAALHGSAANRLKHKMLQARDGRPHPMKDDKVLLGWNGLMVSAFAKAARVLQDTRYLQIAVQADEFLVRTLRTAEGRWLGRYREGEAKHLAYLDDYAFYAWAKLELYETTMDIRYLDDAKDLARAAQQLFGEAARGGYYLSGHDAEKLLTRSKVWYDGALPSGNSAMAYVLARLAMLTGDEELTKWRDEQISAGYQEAKSHPAGFAFFALSLQLLLYPVKEVVIAAHERSDAEPWIQKIHEQFSPQLSLLVRLEANKDRVNQVAPFSADQNAMAGRPTAYVCENFACHAPITDLETLLEELGVEV